MRCLGIGLWCFVLNLFSYSVHAKDEAILWSMNHFPPFIVQTEKIPGDGSAIAFINSVMKRAPDIKHRFERANFTRVIGLMKDGVFTCNPSLLKTPEREAFIEYSLPIAIALPHHIVTKKENIEKFASYLNKDGKIDLNRLFRDPNLILSLPKDRAYPKVINDALTQVKEKENIRIKLNNFASPIKQLKFDWIDYTILYPAEIQSYSKTEGFELAYLPIEKMPPFILGRVGCTKGEYGTRVIKRLNKIIREEGPNPQWNQYQYRYLDKNTVKRIQYLIKKYKPFEKQ